MPGKHKARDVMWWREYRARRKEQGRPASTGGPNRKPPIPLFVAWDGEGITDPDGSHRYVMLANSNGDVLEAESIDTQEAFDFLIDHTPARSTAVAYGASYDATMILRALPRETIATLMADETQFGVTIGLGQRVYCVQYRQRKYLSIKRLRKRNPAARWTGAVHERLGRGYFVQNPVSKKWSPDYDGKVMLWDVLGFFQSSFVEALGKYNIDAPLDEIAAMKGKRSTFTDAEVGRMKSYCVAECVALVALYNELWLAFCRAGIRPRRHDGAGAAAGELLRMQGVKEHISPEPAHLAAPIATAYFGGRIELCKLGRSTGPVFAADLASAYPAAAASLPTLYGFWRRAKTVAGFSLSKVRWTLPLGESWYPLPYQHQWNDSLPADRGGMVLAPGGGAGARVRGALRRHG